MDEEEDLTLPDDPSETDSKISFGEKRELSDNQKKLLKNQKEFELNIVEGKKDEKVKELKEKKKDEIYKWIIGAVSVLFLLGLYFWLVY